MPGDTKRCPGCGETTPRSEWHKGSDGGLQSYCPPCGRKAALARFRRIQEQFPDGFPPVAEKPCARCKIVQPATEFFRQKWHSTGLNPRCRTCERDARLARIYGLTEQQLKEMDACVICGSKDQSTLHIDHCHDTGIVRGRLCRTCNIGVGMFQENPTLMRRAANYIAKSKAATTATSCPPRGE